MNPLLPWDLEDPAWDITYMTSPFCQCGYVEINEAENYLQVDQGDQGDQEDPQIQRVPVIGWENAENSINQSVTEIKKQDIMSIGFWWEGFCFLSTDISKALISQKKAK